MNTTRFKEERYPIFGQVFDKRAVRYLPKKDVKKRSKDDNVSEVLILHKSETYVIVLLGVFFSNSHVRIAKKY